MTNAQDASDVDPIEEPSEKTSTRRAFIKSGSVVAGGLALTGVYTRPSVESFLLNDKKYPSGGRKKPKDNNKRKPPKPPKGSQD